MMHNETDPVYTRMKQVIGSDKITMMSNTIGIPIQTLSHVNNGRNRVSIDILKAFHYAKPEVSLNWLLFGEGGMYGGNITKVEETISIPTDIQRMISINSSLVENAFNTIKCLKEQNMMLKMAMDENLTNLGKRRIKGQVPDSL